MRFLKGNPYKSANIHKSTNPYFCANPYKSANGYNCINLTNYIEELIYKKYFLFSLKVYNPLKYKYIKIYLQKR